VAAVVASGNGAVKASAAWLFGTYAVITIGELFLSPMGLSLVSKLRPPRIVALMMGGWFLSTSIGNKLSGVLSGLWNFYENKAYFFLTNALLAMIAVIGIFILLPWLRRVVKENS
jgi:POT family proton-dependent oligopeptide transporter